MTEPCDSWNVLRDLQEPRPRSWSTGDIEYYDTDLQSDSESTLSSQHSFPSSSKSALRRGVKSFDDLQKPFKQRNHRLERIANLSPILPTYLGSTTTSDVGDCTDAKPSSSRVGKLCESCLGMSIENMAQTGGYKHSRISELLKSSEWCKLCETMVQGLDILRWTNFTADRYQIAVSLRKPGDGAKVRFDSTQGGQPCSPTGHFNSRPRAHFEDGFSRLYAEVIDLHSWEPHEDIDLNGNDCGFLPPFLEPDGTRLRSLGCWVLYCLTEEHDPATEFGIKYVRQIGSDTSSSRSLDIAAGWLASCLSAEAPPKLEDWKPPGYWDRYIDEAEDSKVVSSNSEVASLTTQNPLRLVEIPSDARGKATSIRVIHTDGQHYQYAALSYCWGKAQPGDSRPWQTKWATLNSHLQGINRLHLPQTIQDAIFICQKLRISYLWVDSLCIIQDLTSDWETEAAKMSGIYLGSLLTLSLSASVSAEHGCFNHLSQSNMESGRSSGQLITIDTRLRDGSSTRLHIMDRLYNPTLFRDEVRGGVLGQRAWALQEHIMPQRTLYFTSKQLLWECRHCRLSEDNYPQTQRNLLYPICDYGFPLGATAIIEMWYKRVVRNYTRRQLTYEKDKLVAISALARATHLNRHIGYVAGLWRDCIVPGLLWIRRGPGFKSRTYSCPTWSWASQNSTVSYTFATPPSYTAKPSELFPRVRDVSWVTKPENPFGDVLFAHIDLDTTIALGAVLRDNTFSHWASDDPTFIVPESGQKETLCGTARMDDTDGGGRDVVVANMGHRFLLLEPPSLSSGEYRRVGISFPIFASSKKTQPHMDDLTRGWTQRTIRLV